MSSITSSMSKTSLLSPLCAVCPLTLATVTKLQIQRTLETIYEEEDDEKETTASTILPSSCNNFFIPNSQPSALFAWSKLLLRMMYIVAPRWIYAVNQPYY
ncbi:hypothetical protein VIGAN_02285000, partial [Vigna angularis var. angularis]